MRELFFYDAMCAAGMPLHGGNVAATPEALLAEMDYYGIDRALVRHVNLDAAGAVLSNRVLADFLRSDSSGRLRGVWCILPEQCDELPEPDEFFRDMKQNRIGAITLSPFAHRWIPCRETIGKIMDAAAERHIPVLLDAFTGKWNELYNFVRMFPRNITFAMDRSKHGPDRLLRPLLENFENFHYVISCHWVPEGIRDLAERYGARRLLYGSDYPFFNQGSMMLPLKQSTLPEADIARIAGGNLNQLLEEAQL